MNLVFDGDIDKELLPKEKILDNIQDEDLVLFYKYIYLSIFQVPMNIKDIYQLFINIRTKINNDTIERNLSSIFYFVYYVKECRNKEFIIPPKINEYDPIPNLFDYIEKQPLQFFNIYFEGNNDLNQLLIEYITDPIKNTEWLKEGFENIKIIKKLNELQIKPSDLILKPDGMTIESFIFPSFNEDNPLSHLKIGSSDTIIKPSNINMDSLIFPSITHSSYFDLSVLKINTESIIKPSFIDLQSLNFPIF